MGEEDDCCCGVSDVVRRGERVSVFTSAWLVIGITSVVHVEEPLLSPVALLSRAM